MDDNIPIIVAVVAGLFALLGGFIGAWLARRTEYEKWLRQERSVAFTEFLKQVHSVREKAADFIYDPDMSERDRDMKTSQLFFGLNGQENIVRLYLRKSERDRFSKLKEELSILLNPMTGQVRRIKNVDKVLSEIQSIFEQTIHG
jgi:hypothetical protein